MMSCEEYQELLSAYLDAELSEADSLRVRAHIEGCAACYNLLNIYRDISRSIGDSLADAPAGLSEGVMGRIQSGEADRVKTAEKRRRTLRIVVTRYLPVAACLAIILPTLVYLVGGGLLGGDRSSNVATPREPGGAANGGNYMLDVSGDDYAMAPHDSSYMGDEQDIWGAAGPAAAPGEAPIPAPPPDGGRGDITSSAPDGGIDPKNAYDSGNDGYGDTGDGDKAGNPEATTPPAPPAALTPSASPTPSSDFGVSYAPPTDALPPYTVPPDYKAIWDAVDVSGYYALIAFRGELPSTIQRLGQQDGYIQISKTDALSLMGQYGASCVYIKFGLWEAEKALVAVFDD